MQQMRAWKILDATDESLEDRVTDQCNRGKSIGIHRRSKEKHGSDRVPECDIIMSYENQEDYNPRVSQRVIYRWRNFLGNRLEVEPERSCAP